MILFLTFITFAIATPLLPLDISEWSEWVTTTNPTARCIDRKTNNCMWLGTLELNIQADEAQFTIEGQSDAPGWIRLPGKSGLWPVNVQINGTHATIIDHNGYPEVFVSEQTMHITGTIVWNAIPKELPIPKTIGIVSATQENKTLPIQLDEKGQLLLEQTDNNTNVPPILTISRLWSDDITPTLTTTIRIQNGSAPQNINLGSVDTEKGQLIAIDSSISNWVDSNRELLVYAPIGTHSISYTLAFDPQTTSITPPKIADNWPDFEYWSINNNIAQRQVIYTGLKATDSSQNPVAEWTEFPLYTREVHTPVEFQVLLRGNPTPPPNALQLNRVLWPKLNGSGYWIEDTINGTMQHDWELIPPARLQVQSIEQNQFAQSILQDSNDVTTIPIRTTKPFVQIISETNDNDILFEPWNTEFTSVTMTVQTPHSWTLLYWKGLVWSNLWGLFVNLILSIAWWKRQRPTTINGSLLIVGSCLGGLVAPMTTTIWQILRWFLNRPSQHSWMFILAIGWSLAALHESQNDNFWEEDHQSELYKQENFTSLKRKNRSFYTQHNTKTIQLGVGLPTWKGTSTVRGWIDGQPESEPMSILVLDPDTKRWLAILAGLLIVSLGWRRTNLHLSKTALCMLIGMGWSTVVSLDASADTSTSPTVVQTQLPLDLPSANVTSLLLDHHFPNICTEDCINIALADLTMDAQTKRMHVWLEVHALEEAVLKIPGPIEQWAVDSIQREGTPILELRKSEQGFLEAKIPAGVWSIDISGPVTQGIQLEWPMRPHRIDVSKSDWAVQGILDNGQINDRIQLTPTKEQSTPNQHVGLLSWTQNFSLDSQWLVEHTLTRSPTSAEHSLSIPLALREGERILSTEMRSDDGKWIAQLASGETTVQWTSQLPISTQLVLEYEDILDLPIALEWSVECGYANHCTFQGPPQTKHIGNNNHWIPTWHPYPSEQLHVSVMPLNAATGQTSNIQQLQLEHNIGHRWIRSSLKLTTESSVQEQIELGLPEGSTITSVHINNTPYPFAPSTTLALLTTIGQDELSIQWKSPNTEWLTTLPSPTIDIPISNATLSVVHNDNSAVLWASDFWTTAQPPWLVCIGLLLLMALGLARHPASNRSFGTWVFVLLGSSFAGFDIGKVLLPIIVIHHLTQRKWWTTVLDLLIVGMLSLCSIWILIDPSLPIWFWEKEQLQWYQDVTTSIPTIRVWSIPSIWGQIVWFTWSGWIVYRLIPSLVTTITNLRKRSPKKNDESNMDDASNTLVDNVPTEPTDSDD